MLLKLFFALACASLLAQGTPRVQAEYCDKFEDSTMNSHWDLEEVSGPTISVENGEMVVKGEFAPASPGVKPEVRGYLNFSSRDFLSLEMDITVKLPQGALRDKNLIEVGMFVAREKRLNAGECQTLGEIVVERNSDGIMAVRVVNEPVDEGHPMPAWTIPTPDQRVISKSLDRTFRLSIARAEGTRDQAVVMVGNVTLFTAKDLAWFERETSDLKAGFFIRGKPGDMVSVSVDNVRWTCLKD